MNTSAEAQSLLRQGRREEAEQAYARLLERQPDNVEALNVVAIAALRSGEHQRARELLESALRANPVDPITHHHLARAHEAAGNLEAALGEYEETLRLRPQLYVARLHFAQALEGAGRARRALVNYARALKEAQKQGRWLNSQSTPPGLIPAVEHAVHTVRGSTRQLYASLFEPIAERFGRDSLGRVERSLRIYLCEESAESPDPRQQPTFLYFPDLPPTPYFDRGLFDWIDALEAQAPAIRAELERLLPSAQGRERVFTSEELERQNLRGEGQAPTWNGYYFYRHGERRPDNCAACPATAAALDAMPLAHVREHAPEVLFSVFTPGTHLLPHRGVTNTRVVGHLPLIIPLDCALRVGGEQHDWREGRVVVFDDTYEHEAWNRSDRTRVVLIFDLWNPHLTAAERAAIAELVAAIGDFDSEMKLA